MSTLGIVHDMDVHVDRVMAESGQVPQGLTEWMHATRRTALDRFGVAWQAL